jgi:hypothetical protein
VCQARETAESRRSPRACRCIASCVCVCVCVPGPLSVSPMAATEAQNEAEPEECPICMCELVDACRTSCGHVFCSGCLAQAAFPAETPGLHVAAKCPLCRGPISLFSTVSVGTEVPLKQPAVSTIFGSVYLQGGVPGIAAYHFDAPDDCYISYAEAPAAWRLDDGSPMPEKKQFVNPSYDATTRTFTGSIEWGETTTINGGDARWEYRLEFSASMNVISGGCKWPSGADGTQRNKITYPTDLIYWRGSEDSCAPPAMPHVSSLISGIFGAFSSIFRWSSSPIQVERPDLEARREMALLLQTKGAASAQPRGVVNIQP